VCCQLGGSSPRGAGMEALQVATLRGICARYIEGSVTPLLTKLQDAQRHFDEQLRLLSEAVDRSAESQISCKPLSLDELRARIDRLERTAAQEGGPLASRGSALLEELWPELERRVPSHEQFDELVAQVARKADAKQVPCLSDFRDLEAIVGGKADSCSVATHSQMQRIAEKLDRKAQANKVPTLTQLHELTAVVERKANMASVPSISQFDELTALVERKTNPKNLPNPAHVQKLAAALERKADAEDVPTLAQIHELSLALQGKAAMGEVPTLAQFQELASRVPSLAQFDELATKVNRCSRELSQRGPSSFTGPRLPTAPPSAPTACAGGMPCAGATGGVVWLVPAAMDSGMPWDMSAAMQQPQTMPCPGVWAPTQPKSAAALSMEGQKPWGQQSCVGQGMPGSSAQPP